MELLTQPANALFEIVRYSHHFTVEPLSQGPKRILEEFCRGLIKFKLVPSRGVLNRVPDVVFAAADKQRTRNRLHINQLGEFLRHVADCGIRQDQIRAYRATMYTPDVVEWELQPGLSDREYQTGFIEYGAQPLPVSKLIVLQTGKGKSYIGLKIAQALGTRILLLIKAGYVDKWVIDFMKTMRVDKSDIYVIKGAASIKKAFVLRRDGQFNFKAVICTMETLRSWVAVYEHMGKEATADLGFECAPYEFYEHFGIGFKLIDEVHLNFHFGFKSDLYTHVPNSLALTATFTDKDPFVRLMYERMFPAVDRCKQIAYDRYAMVSSLHFQFEKPELIKHNRYGNPMFSYAAVEDSIRKWPKVLSNYLDMLVWDLSCGYIKCPRPKKRALVFAQTEAMIVLMVARLKKTWPHLDIRKYMSADPFENVLEADICVSTLGSAGTAIDIPDLTHCYLTVSVESEKANEQAVGRLRKLPDGVMPEFSYWVIANNHVSVRYHQAKMKLLEGKALHQKFYQYPKVV